jgi:hypothetical protein
VLVYRAIMDPFPTVLKRDLLFNECLLIPLTAICVFFELSSELTLFDRQFIVYDLSIVVLIAYLVFG